MGASGHLTETEKNETGSSGRTGSNMIDEFLYCELA